MRLAVFVTFASLVSSGAFAQQAVQQPVVSSTSVSTTVSVPDRGSISLGGVSSALSGRSQYGPLRTGTAAGISRQATSISTHVYIHDMQAMDEALLNSASSGSSQRGLSIAARSALLEQRKGGRNVNTNEITVSVVEKATKFEQLALKADDAGKYGVAKLHWQAAAKYGSKLAETRLAESTQTPSTQPPAPSQTHP